MMKALFITTTNIFDNKGNGGVKASIEHLSFVQKYYGTENVQVCIFVRTDEINDAETEFKGSKVDAFAKLTGNLKLVIAALLGCRLYMPWEEKKLYDYIDSVAPDIVFLDFSFLGRIMKRKAKYKTVVFFHNMEADYTYNKVKNEGLQYLPALWAAKKNDKWATLADRVICLNERDSKRMQQLYGRKSDMNLPISFKDSFDSQKAHSNYDRKILFLGSLFEPNQDGIEWFMTNVLPKLDNIKLDIVGRGFETKREEYEKISNVKVIGSVENPSDYYYQYAAVVMPIRYGAGMKVKTAEAMMYGRHIFASDEALEGYDVENINGIQRCNSAEEYVAAINDYFNGEKLKKFEKDVRERFLQKYESECVYNDFKNMLDCIADK